MPIVDPKERRYWQLVRELNTKGYPKDSRGFRSYPFLTPDKVDSLEAERDQLFEELWGEDYDDHVDHSDVEEDMLHLADVEED